MWNEPNTDWNIAGVEVHVWRVRPLHDETSLAQWESLLSESERVRAARYRFAPDRRQFVVTRGTLRVLLGRYIGVHPLDVTFEYSVHGKPILSASMGEEVKFNVSHSDGLTLVAVTRDREVGVDVERIQPLPDILHLAAACFSQAELSEFHQVSRQEQLFCFYDCWVRKEAFAKAVGVGLSMPLQGFDVSLISGQPACLLAIREPWPRSVAWALAALEPGPGYAAAIVAEGRSLDIRCWDADHLRPIV